MNQAQINLIDEQIRQCEAWAKAADNDAMYADNGSEDRAQARQWRAKAAEWRAIKQKLETAA